MPKPLQLQPPLPLGPQIVTPSTATTLVERLQIYRTFGGGQHTHTLMDMGHPTVVVTWVYPSDHPDRAKHTPDWGVVEVVFHGNQPRVLVYDAVVLARATMTRDDQFDWMDVAKQLLRPLRKAMRKT